MSHTLLKSAAVPDDIYRSEAAGLTLVDPYDEFLAKGGKRWEAVRPMVLEVGLVSNLKRLSRSGRNDSGHSGKHHFGSGEGLLGARGCRGPCRKRRLPWRA